LRDAPQARGYRHDQPEYREELSIANSDLLSFAVEEM